MVTMSSLREDEDGDAFMSGNDEESGAGLNRNIQSDNESSGSDRPSQRQRTDSSQLRSMENEVEAAAGGGGENQEQPVQTVPSKVSGSADLTEAGERRNVHGALGAITKVVGRSVKRSGAASSTDPHWDENDEWDSRGDTEKSLYDDDDFEYEEDDEGGGEYGDEFQASVEENQLRQEALSTMLAPRASHSAPPGPGSQDSVSRMMALMQDIQTEMPNLCQQIKEGKERAEAAINIAGEAHNTATQAEVNVVHLTRRLDTVEAGRQEDSARATALANDIRDLEARFERMLGLMGGIEADQAHMSSELYDIQQRENRRAWPEHYPNVSQSQFHGISPDILKAMVKRHVMQDKMYWKCTLMVSRLRRNGRQSDDYRQVKASLRDANLAFLIDGCDRYFVTKNNNIRITFKDQSEARQQCTEAKRTLRYYNNRHVRVNIMVPPEDVNKKNVLLRLGKELKRSGECQNFEVVSARGSVLLKTFSSRDGVQLHDLHQDTLVRAEDENCAICVETLNDGFKSQLKNKTCNHSHHFACTLSNLIKTGVACCQCRTMPENFGPGVVTCPRCLNGNSEGRFMPQEFRVSQCGHVHHVSCISDYAMQHGVNISELTADGLYRLARLHATNVTCYQCRDSDTDTGVIWNPVVAELETVTHSLRRVTNTTSGERRSGGVQPSRRSETGEGNRDLVSPRGEEMDVAAAAPDEAADRERQLENERELNQRLQRMSRQDMTLRGVQPRTRTQPPDTRGQRSGGEERGGQPRHASRSPLPNRRPEPRDPQREDRGNQPRQAGRGYDDRGIGRGNQPRRGGRGGVRGGQHGHDTRQPRRDEPGRGRGQPRHDDRRYGQPQQGGSRSSGPQRRLSIQNADEFSDTEL